MRDFIIVCSHAPNGKEKSVGVKRSTVENLLALKEGGRNTREGIFFHSNATPNKVVL